MGFKEIAKKKIGDPKTIIGYRFSSAKIVFILSTLLFFLHFFLIGARVVGETLMNSLSLSYAAFIVSFGFFLYYLFRKLLFGRSPEWIKFIIGFLVLVLTAVSLLPIILGEQLSTLI